MAETNKNRQTQDPEQVIEQGLGRFELFIERNGKAMLIVLGAIVVLVGGYFSYKYLYLAPRADKASAAMFAAQNQFERDSFALALNGNASFDGFLTIGVCGDQPSLGEDYISTGSLYLCSGAFLPLGLPASDPFWSDPDEPWTQKKIWDGADFPADHKIE